MEVVVLYTQKVMVFALSLDTLNGQLLAGYGIALVLIGLIFALKPDWRWRMRRQFKGKQALEPRAAELRAARIAGGAVVAGGAVLIVLDLIKM